MRFSKVRDVKSPTRGTTFSAGIDFYVPYGHYYTIPPHTDMLIPSGIKAEIPKGYMLMAADKSGIVTSYNAQLRAGLEPRKSANVGAIIIGAKIVDEDYQGEIYIHLINTSNNVAYIESGTKIAQFILVPVFYDSLEEVSPDELFTEVSERGSGAFSSTGIK